MKNKILALFILLSTSVCTSQKKITWEDLSKVQFTEKYFSQYDAYFLYPKFMASIKELESKQITILGYFLNIDPKDKIYILSKGPMSSCFFCGVGGPETAIELKFLSNQTFKTDDIISVTGTLKLNSDDIEHFNYILTNCVATLVK
ncbi:hypothetical protein [Algibacter pectinivorans]|uniref:DUF3299 domain-containing protein n=1 Tax=Algibacter pectinivorans TaxID=870482 RepID=A0A1I1RYN7_9FLAO|nr:hypothetical protein [Algibacter pectinivorans]SFD39411.1 hypothetical protein SAMN04487987_11217 [Algibacter pectinivorans]